MMSAKMATPGLLKITVFWNKVFDVIVYVNDVTNKILPRYSNYIVDVFMWPKFGNCSFLWEKLSQPQFYKDLTRKTAFFERWSWFKFINLGVTLGRKIEILHQCGKRVKTKSQKVLGGNSYICRSYRGKTGRGAFLPPTPPPFPPSWIGLKLVAIHW